MTASLIGFVLIPLGVLVNAWLMFVAWAWFLVPMGAHPLGFAASCGLACIFAVLISDAHETKKAVPKNENEFAEIAAVLVAKMILKITFFFVFAGIAKLAM